VTLHKQVRYRGTYSNKKQWGLTIGQHSLFSGRRGTDPDTAAEHVQKEIRRVVILLTYIVYNSISNNNKRLQLRQHKATSQPLQRQRQQLWMKTWTGSAKTYLKQVAEQPPQRSTYLTCTSRIFVEIGMLWLFHIFCSDAPIACHLFNLVRNSVIHSLGWSHFNFAQDLCHQKTACMLLHLAISLEHWLVTDRQTDRQTNEQTEGQTYDENTYCNV